MKQTPREKFICDGGQIRSKEISVSLLWAACTAAAAANVINPSFKSSTVPLQTSLLAY